MPTQAIFVLGPAGSGKTSLVGGFGRWVAEEFNLSVSFVNLDPAVEHLPYTPDFDVRDFISVKDIMVKEGLGPNGAILRSMDMLAEMSEVIVKALKKLRSDIMFVDTPGQSELFVFRDSGPKLIKAFKRFSIPIALFLNESTLTHKVKEATITYLMSLIVRLRLDIPVLPIVSKSDLLSDTSTHTFPDELSTLSLKLRSEGEDLLSEFMNDLLTVVKHYAIPTRLVKVSVVTREGFEDLYALIHEVFCACGDLT